MSPDHWSKLTWDTVSAGGYDLLGPIGYLDRKRDRAYKQRVIVTPAILFPSGCPRTFLRYVYMGGDIISDEDHHTSSVIFP